MSRFNILWANHPGRGLVCDEDTFGNQCAMRMGHALRKAGVNLEGLKTCVGYDRRKFGGHAPGHVRSAQELANRFYRKPKAHALGAKSFKLMRGSIKKNIDSFKNRKGMVFIRNGWGSTDHIDVWKGNAASGTLKGGEASYLSKGDEVWFWEFD